MPQSETAVMVKPATNDFMRPPFEIIGWEILTPWRGGYMALLCTSMA
jgi:hypothetical protein